MVDGGWTPVNIDGVLWWPELPPSAFVALNLQKNDLSTVFVRYFLHVRSSVSPGSDNYLTNILYNVFLRQSKGSPPNTTKQIFSFKGGGVLPIQRKKQVFLVPKP